jgi:hypothetical protein
MMAAASVQISTKPTENMSCSAGVCAPTAKKAVLNVTDLANMLAGGDVTVKSGNLAKDIEIDAALSWTSPHRLMLDSFHSIDFNSAISVAGTSGALTITTNDGGSGGDFQFFGKGHVKFWDSGSDLVINGNPYHLISTMKELRFVSAHRDPFVALAKGLDLRKHNYHGAPIPETSGMFEGLGNTISNLTIIDSTDGTLAGLFGRVDFGGAIRDVVLTSVNIHANGSEQGVGSLAAQNEGTISHITATGVIEASGGSASVGGLAGSNEEATISKSALAMNISVGDGRYMAGGLVGDAIGEPQALSSVDKSFSTGAVSGGDGTMVGGLIGRNLSGSISNSYATGAVSGGNNAIMGGLIGVQAGSDPAPVLTSSYSTGAVNSGSGATVGGLIGQDMAGSQITAAYWDLDTSGVSNPHQGAGNIPDDPGITGLNDAQLKAGLPAGFDKRVWAQNPKINNGYPYLIANPPPK